jgi:septum formation protein
VSAAIVLASASPRRRELLTLAGLVFDVRPVDLDEDLGAFTDPEGAALELATRKARAAAGREAAERTDAAGGARWIVGADTVVAVPRGERWSLLGKPADEGEARAMLALLSGTRHAVVTGVCVVRLPGGAEAAASERTWVRMRAIEPAELEAYARSGAGLDKAGGYAIQEGADAFVSELSGGGKDNVVGLPVPLTLRLLARLGAPLPGAPPPSPGLVRPGPGG